MNFKKISNKFVIIIILLIVILVSCIVILKYKNNNNCKNEISNLKKQNEQLQNKLSETYKKLDSTSNRTCKYTRTYRFIENYDYNGENELSRFIIVDQYQNSKPVILEYYSGLINFELVKDNYYEITFNSSVINGIQVGYEIISIVHTDKIGIEQIQEEC